MIAIPETCPARRRAAAGIAGALLALCAAMPAQSQTRVIETRPLKLIGDGAAPAAAPAPSAVTIETRPLRLMCVLEVQGRTRTGGRFSTRWDLFETIYKEATGGAIKESTHLVQGEVPR